MLPFNPFHDNGDPGWMIALTLFHLLSLAVIPFYVVYLYLRHEREARRRSNQAVFTAQVETALRSLQEARLPPEREEAASEAPRRAA